MSDIRTAHAANQESVRAAVLRENRRSLVRIILTYVFAFLYALFAGGVAFVLISPYYLNGITKMGSGDIQTLLSLFAGVSAASLGIIGYWFGNRNLTKEQKEIADVLLAAYQEDSSGGAALEARITNEDEQKAKDLRDEANEEKIRKAYDKAVSNLMVADRPNIVGITVGNKYKNGKKTAQKAIRVHVKSKTQLSKIPSDHRLPEFIEGVPIDVMQTTKPKSQGRIVDHSVSGLKCRKIDGKQETIQPGVSIGFAGKNGKPGTLGAIVWDIEDNRPMALTAGHVLDTPNFKVVTHPAGFPTKSHKIGTFKRSGESVDAALVDLVIKRYSPKLFAINKSFTAIGNPTQGDRVKKIGASTGLTCGEIDGCGCFAPGFFKGVNSPVACIVSDPLSPQDCEISAPGDSGAVWFRETSDGELIGVALHVQFMHMEKIPTAIAIYLPHTLNSLSVNLIKPTV